MKLFRWTGIVLFAGLLAGCQNKAKDSPRAGEPSRDVVETIRQSYQRSDPNARVGVVMAVKPELQLAAVGDIPVREFREGDVLTFIDTDRQVLVAGRVLNIVNGALHIKYEQPPKNGRSPREGDLAIRVP